MAAFSASGSDADNPFVTGSVARRVAAVLGVGIAAAGISVAVTGSTPSRQIRRPVRPISVGAFAGYVWGGEVGSVRASWKVPRIRVGSPYGSAGTWIGAQEGGGHGDRVIPDTGAYNITDNTSGTTQSLTTRDEADAPLNQADWLQEHVMQPEQRRLPTNLHRHLPPPRGQHHRPEPRHAAKHLDVPPRHTRPPTNRHDQRLLHDRNLVRSIATSSAAE